MNRIKKSVSVICVAFMVFAVGFGCLPGYKVNAIQDLNSEKTDPFFEVVVTDLNPDYITLTLVMKNCIGLLQADTIVEFSKDILKYEKSDLGDDAKILDEMSKKTNENTFLFLSSVIARTDGTIAVYSTFGNKLYSSSDYASLFAVNGEEYSVNGENFKATDIRFIILNDDIQNTQVKIRTNYVLENGEQNTIEDTFEIMTSDHVHTYPDKWNVIINTTNCYDSGYKTVNCTICGNVKKEIIPPLPCNYTEWILVKKPTATSEGCRIKKCTMCGFVHMDNIRLYDTYTNNNWKLAIKDEMLTVCLGMTAQELVENVLEGAVVTDKDGNVLENNVPVASGMQVDFYFNEEKIAEITVVVKGDIDGDTKINAADARLALRASVGLEELSDWQYNAANVESETRIDAGAARCILRAAVGLANPDKWIQGSLPY